MREDAVTAELSVARHSFKKTNITKPAYCGHCKKLIYGLRAYVVCCTASFSHLFSVCELKEGEGVVLSMCASIATLSVVSFNAQARGEVSEPGMPYDCAQAVPGASQRRLWRSGGGAGVMPYCILRYINHTTTGRVISKLRLNNRIEQHLQHISTIAVGIR